MNCKEIKYFLLGCENPDQPPADVKAHLTVCSGCRDWQNQLAMIEMNIPFLPVPASAVRAQLLRKVLSQPRLLRGDDEVAAESAAETKVAVKDTVGPVLSSTETKSSLLLTDPNSWKRRAGILQFFRRLEPSARRFAAGGVAAAILLLIFGWMVLRTHQRPTTDNPIPRPFSDPLLSSIIQRDMRLADAENPSDRFLALADLADDLNGEIKKLAPLPEAKDVLGDLVKRYQEVLGDGLLPVAKKLPDENRDELLNKVGNRLHAAARTTDELGDQLGAKIPNSSREALRKLTRAAYEGNRQLLDLRAQNVPPRDNAVRDNAVLVRRDNP